MSFDGLFTHAIVHELDQKLTTGRVAKVSQPYPAELIITIRAHRHNYPVLISANPTYPRIQITEIPYKNPAVPTNFTMTIYYNLIFICGYLNGLTWQCVFK